MKPTQEQVIAWAREAGIEDYESTSLSGNSELDRTLQVGEYPVGESVFALVALAYEAGRKDENEACALICDHEINNAINLSMSVTAGNCADKIRARREQ